MASPAGSNVAIPYVAPWATTWNKYSTQVYDMPQVGSQAYTLTVPDGQWWRVVFCAVHWGMSATVANRLAVFIVFGASSTPVELVAPAAMPASTNSFVTYGVGLNTVAGPIVANQQFQSVAIVDLIWPPATAMTARLSNQQASDAANTPPSLGVEIYTEFTAPPSAPILIPSPVLT